MSSSGGPWRARRARSAGTPAASGRTATARSDLAEQLCKTSGAMPSLIAEPIGIFRTPYRDLAEVPRQPAEARGVAGRIELDSGRGFEFALEDLASWRYLWVLFWF